MKLGPKLFLSYLAVAAVALLVVAVATSFIAPESFRQRMMRPEGAGGGPRAGMMQSERRTEVDAAVETAFRVAVNNALLVGSLGAVLGAALMSWLASQGIVRPLRALVDMSRFIAAGHYRQRLEKGADDELGDLVASFNQMAMTLDETEAMRRQLLADVTHELKTPLAGLKAYVEGLQDGVIASTPETFALLEMETSRLGRLVEDLSELSRIEAGQLSIAPQPLDPAALLAPVVERMRPQFAGRDLALAVEAPALPLVLADADRAAQVLTNILGNALQYTPPGGRVDVRAARDGAAVRFSIRDTGPGLAPEDVERVFQRFYRVDKSRARASGGSGIGLTIARSLAEAQGGRLWAESPGPGQGSTFHFTLPLATTFTKTSHNEH